MHNTVIHAPLTSPTILADIGCGTGIITTKLSTLHPNAERVFGIDISPVPTHQNKGGNVEFIQGDIRRLAGTDPRLRLGSLDFVFNRLLICGMTDWPGYVREVAALLRPGGWAEMQDCAYVWYLNGKVCSDEWAWMKALREGAERKGMDLDCGRNIKGYMEDAGFVDVQVLEYRFPWWTEGAEGREETRKLSEHAINEWWRLWWHLIPKMVDGLGYGKGDIEDLQNDLKERTKAEVGKEMTFYSTFGRKPEAD